MPFFDAEYLRNSTIYSTIYRQFQWNTIGTYTRPYTQHCRFEWPWVTEQNIQWQEASRGLSAVSLRQLSLLLLLVVSLGQMSITNRSKCPSVRANVAQSARCHDLQNPTAPAPQGRRWRHLACIFMRLGTQLIRSRIFNFGACAPRHRSQLNPAASTHALRIIHSTLQQ